MYSAKHRLLLLTLSLSVISFSTGCGNRGDLYLPDPKAEPIKVKTEPAKKTKQQ